jgi:hypothetical protein
MHMNKVLQFFLTSVVNWKTTAAGVVTLINSLGEFLTTIATVVNAVIDGDPSTIADFGSIKSSFALVILGFGLVFSKDGDKSTEDVRKVQG